MCDQAEMKRLAHGAATECARIVIRKGEVDTVEKVKEYFKEAYDEIFDYIMGHLKMDCKYHSCHMHMNEEQLLKIVKTFIS